MSAKTTPRHVTSACQQSCRSSTVIENRVHIQEEEICVKQVVKPHGKCNCTIFLPLVNEDLRSGCAAEEPCLYVFREHNGSMVMETHCGRMFRTS